MFKKCVRVFVKFFMRFPARLPQSTGSRPEILFLGPAGCHMGPYEPKGAQSSLAAIFRSATVLQKSNHMVWRPRGII